MRRRTGRGRRPRLQRHRPVPFPLHRRCHQRQRQDKVLHRDSAASAPARQANSWVEKRAHFGPEKGSTQRPQHTLQHRYTPFQTVSVPVDNRCFVRSKSPKNDKNRGPEPRRGEFRLNRITCIQNIICLLARNLEPTPVQTAAAVSGESSVVRALAAQQSPTSPWSRRRQCRGSPY